VMVVGLLSFSSCSNKKSGQEQIIINYIIGDCISDSLMPELNLKINNLNWYPKHNKISFESNYLYYTKTIPSFNNNCDTCLEEVRFLEIIIKDNKLQCRNNWIVLNEYTSGVNTLYTDKKDTSFWNIVNVLKEYCDLRDTSYIYKSEIYDKLPELLKPDDIKDIKIDE